VINLSAKTRADAKPSPLFKYSLKQAVEEMENQAALGEKNKNEGEIPTSKTGCVQPMKIRVVAVL